MCDLRLCFDGDNEDDDMHVSAIRLSLPKSGLTYIVKAWLNKCFVFRFLDLLFEICLSESYLPSVL